MPKIKPVDYEENPLSFQGQLWLGKRDANGYAGDLWWVGNVPKGTVTPKVERKSKIESWSGQRTKSRSRIKSREFEIAFTLEDLHRDNMAVALLGNKVTTASGSFTGSDFDTFNSGLAVNSVVRLRKPNASSIVIKDSAGAPATLVADTDYKVLDAKSGLIQILSLGSYTQPFRAQYSYAAVKVITGMTADDSDEYTLFCALINDEPSPDQAVAFEFFRLTLDPASTFELIHEDQGSYEVKATGLRDDVAAVDSEKGPYFRFLYNDDNLS